MDILTKANNLSAFLTHKIVSVWKAAKYILLLFLVDLLAMAVVSEIGIFFYADYRQRFQQSKTIADALLVFRDFTDTLAIPTMVLSGIVLSLIFWLKNRKTGFQKPKKELLVWSAAIGTVANLVTSIVLVFIPSAVATGHDISADFNTPLGTVLALLATIVVAPVTEELLCRYGMLNTLLQRKEPVVFAIIAQAVLFGLTHGNLVQIAYAVVIGIGLGYLAYKTKSVTYSIVAHSAFNLTSCIGYLVCKYTGINAIWISVILSIIAGLTVFIRTERETHKNTNQKRRE